MMSEGSTPGKHDPEIFLISHVADKMFHNRKKIVTRLQFFKRFSRGAQATKSPIFYFINPTKFTLNLTELLTTSKQLILKSKQKTQEFIYFIFFCDSRKIFHQNVINFKKFSALILIKFSI